MKCDRGRDYQLNNSSFMENDDKDLSEAPAEEPKTETEGAGE